MLYLEYHLNVSVCKARYANMKFFLPSLFDKEKYFSFERVDTNMFVAFIFYHILRNIILFGNNKTKNLTLKYTFLKKKELLIMTAYSTWDRLSFKRAYKTWKKKRAYPIIWVIEYKHAWDFSFPFWFIPAKNCMGLENKHRNIFLIISLSK